VDSRRKIVSVEQAYGLARPVVAVTGSFPLLLADHVRALCRVRAECGGATLLVLLVAGNRDWLPLHARAELVAALHMVDYVVIPASELLDHFLDHLRPDRVERWEEADEIRARQFIEHVHSRQARSRR
jgi:bifunctional ADP-heptose synthase (sugar kinase/adenylyltransferase)